MKTEDLRHESWHINTDNFDCAVDLAASEIDTTCAQAKIVFADKLSVGDVEAAKAIALEIKALAGLKVELEQQRHAIHAVLGQHGIQQPSPPAPVQHGVPEVPAPITASTIDRADQVLAASRPVIQGRKCLVVEFPDGETVSGATSDEAFVRALTKIGLDEVMRLAFIPCGVDLVSYTRSDRFTQDKVGQYYVMTQLSPESKLSHLRAISGRLGLNLKAKIQ